MYLLRKAGRNIIEGGVVMRSVYLVYGTTCFSVVVDEAEEQAEGQVDFKVIRAERVGLATVGKVETGAYR